MDKFLLYTGFWCTVIGAGMYAHDGEGPFPGMAVAAGIVALLLSLAYSKTN